ncbi:hypothetical protein ACFO5Q_01300 [Kordiimonas lipolytica]|uniref:Uncharacterized protein n=1 Tax=Kordiimonas lipolytica TaxID=1662421 RepID=A0ABV8U5L9_9PROT|nr:hypothetical protein [Kordiimonas lipolytica]
MADMAGTDFLMALLLLATTFGGLVFSRHHAKRYFMSTKGPKPY